MTKSTAEFVLEAKGLVKRFGQVVANKGVDLSVEAGSIHGIVGENGAGKSTLLNMLFGFYQPDEGTLNVEGRPVSFQSAADGLAAGIGMVHQHFMLIEPFTVLENLMLGADLGFRASRSDTRRHLADFNRRFGFDLDPDARIADLSVGEKQRVEIVKALLKGAKILILDEPTAVLTPLECDQLFSLLRDLKRAGTAILFVTHKLNEILDLADCATVIRQGEVVASVETGAVTAADLAELMVGEKVSRGVRPAALEGDQETLLSVSDISLTDDQGRRHLASISFDLKAGEIIGVAGVAGNGQTPLLEVLSGMQQVSSGEVCLKGVVTNSVMRADDPVHLKEKGLVHIPEDRLRHAMVADFSAQDTMILGYTHQSPAVSSMGVLDLNTIKDRAMSLFDQQDVRPPQPSLPVKAFSGGNQQKIVIARELAQNPDVVLVGQPTRGVDIGAATRVYDQLVDLRNAGKAVLIVSADLDELLQLADRLIVMLEGRIVGDLLVADATAETLGLMMSGTAA